MIAHDRIDLVVGTYARLGGRGLVPLALDRATHAWSCGDPVPEITDASHGVYASGRDRFYFVEESDPGRVSCHSRASDRWPRLATTHSAGTAPCHLALDTSERRLAAANYESGSVALWQLDADGLPIDSPATHRMKGSGPNPERQEGSHAHWVGFERKGRHLYCVDLGGDRIVAFPLDMRGGDLPPPMAAYRAPPGSGPRHLCFHPIEPITYLVSELASTLTVLRKREDGSFDPVQIVSTLPGGVSESLGGAIALNGAGDRLYVTNRGHDSIAVFAVHGSGVELVQHVASGGASPRFVLVLDEERRLLVANEEGGTVAVFTLAADGTLKADPIVLDIPGAVFLARVGSGAPRAR